MAAEPPSASDAKPDARFDLMPKMSAFLDVHLLYPMLDFLREKRMYTEEELESARLELLMRSNAVEDAREVWKRVHGDKPVPESLEEKAARLPEERKVLQAAASKAMDAIESLGEDDEEEDEEDFEEEEAEREREKKIAAALSSRGVTPEDLEALNKYSKIIFEDGDYENAARFLYYVLMAQRGNGAGATVELQGRWGKLACEILLAEFDEAVDDVDKLSRALAEVHGPDGENSSSRAIGVQQHAWLLHWSLFCAFGHPRGRQIVSQLLLSEQGIQVCQLVCPWLLRYAAVIVVSDERMQDQMGRVARAIDTERKSLSSDPLCEFLARLKVDLDYEGAREKLDECGAAIESDYFLAGLRDASAPWRGLEAVAFLDPARRILFETYCRLHRHVDIRKLAEQLGVTPTDAEQWAVAMMRGAHLDARIDAAGGVVSIKTTTPSIHQEIIEKTKDLHLRTTHLQANFSAQVRGTRSGTAPSRRK